MITKYYEIFVKPLRNNPYPVYMVIDFIEESEFASWGDKELIDYAVDTFQFDSDLVPYIVEIKELNENDYLTKTN